MSFVFDPSTGLLDTTRFPDEDPLIRQHLQELLQQIPDYVDSIFTFLASPDGWVKNSITGIIEQWGTVTVPNLTSFAQQYVDIPFPTDFTTIYQFTCDIYAEDTNSNVIPISKGGLVLSIDKATFRMQNTGATTTTSIKVVWRAKGK
jgi:hypothetical protein